MRKTIYEYTQYKRYLRDWMISQPSGGRGLKVKLADFLRCQPSFVSQVLADKNKLSLEHAEELNTFLGHSPEEGEYWMLLVLLERAGSRNLQQRFLKQIESIQKQKATEVIKAQYQKEISEEAKAQYYSHWIYAALYALAGSKKYQTAAQLAEYFEREEKEINEVVNFLVKIGLVRREHGRILPTAKSVYLAPGSPHIKSLHLSWRLRSMEKLDSKKSNDMHYSMVLGLKQSQILALRKSLSDQVARIIEEVKDVPAEEIETVVALNLDFFGT